MYEFAILLKCKRPKYRRILRAFKKRLPECFSHNNGYELVFVTASEEQKLVMTEIVKKSLRDVGCEFEIVNHNNDE